MVNSHVPNFQSAVELTAAFQHPHPGFLEQVFRGFFVSREEKQVPEETILVVFDQAVEKVRVPPPEPSGYGLAFMFHRTRNRIHKPANCGVHSSPVYEPNSRKDAGSVSEEETAPRIRISRDESTHQRPGEFPCSVKNLSL